MKKSLDLIMLIELIVTTYKAIWAIVFGHMP